MKKTLTKSSLAAAALLASLILHPTTLLAQGSLTPSGAPVPAMKSLGQIEPRTPIASAPFTITNGGSYYLTTNLTVTIGDAINIEANGVTVDLNGFTLSSTAPGGTGAAIALGPSDCTILNGHITGGVTNNYSGVYSGPGFGYGILGLSSGNIHVTGVTVSGCLNDGIHIGEDFSTIVEACTVYNVGGFGIVANTVSRCTAYACGNTAITASTATDCYGLCNGSAGDGIAVNDIANNCNGSSVGGYGVYVYGSANNCYGLSATGDGIHLGLGTLLNCSGQSVSGDGIHIAQGTANTCSGVSTANGSGIAIDAGAVNNCYGSSDSSCGIYGEAFLSYGGMVNNSYGYCANTAGNGLGIFTHFLANNSVGFCAQNAGIGIHVDDTAVGSVGYSPLPYGPPYSVGLDAYLGVGSIGYSLSGATSSTLMIDYDGN